MANELTKRIDALSREQAIEAAGFVASDLGITASTNVQATAALAEWANHPYAHFADAEELARLLLSVAATVPEHEAAVRTALDGVGRKQLVLGGTEIVALAALALGALQICLSEGKTGETITEKIEKSPDGKEIVVRRRNTTWGISSSLGSLLKKAFLSASK